MAEVKTADTGRWRHGHAVGQAHADFFGFEEFKQWRFDAVIGARRIARRGAYALVFLGYERVVIQAFVFGIAPQIGAHAPVQPFSSGFSQAIGQGFEHDGVVIVHLRHEFGHFFITAQTRGDGKAAQIIGLTCGFRGDKVGQAAARQKFAVFIQTFFALLAQVMPSQHHFFALFIGIAFDIVVVHGVRWPKAKCGIGREPAPLHDFVQHGLRIGIHFFGLLAHYRIIQNRGETACQIPGLEVGRPVDKGQQLVQIDIFEHPPADKTGRGRGVACPIQLDFIGANFGQWP